MNNEGNNWAIEYDYLNDCIVIKLLHFPNEGEIRLYDVSTRDLKDLSKMFRQSAQQTGPRG